AVVYRRPALVAGLSLGLEADVVSGDGPRLESGDYAGDPRGVRLVAEAAGAVGLEPRGVVVRVRSALPAGVGLGSSAALAVAVLRALAAAAARRLARDEELAIATRLEAIFHGHPSGVDPAGAALGGCFRFVRGTPPAIISVRPAVPLPLVIAFGARPRSTGAAVGGLRARWEAEPARHEALFDAVAVAVEDGIRAAETGDLAGLGRAMDRNQTVLETLGVSAPEVADLVGRARAAGALGAKLTGGGAGGGVIALAPTPERLAGVPSGDHTPTIVGRRLAERLLALQQADGSWSIYHRGPGSLSTTIEAYFALKLVETDAREPALARARDFILGQGGLARAGVFTRMWLAYFNQFPWAGVPSMPVELVLLPPWFPVNIYAMSSWARGTVVPLTLLTAHRPSVRIPAEAAVPELWVRPPTRDD